MIVRRMNAEGAVGPWQGLAAGLAALTGWALGSVVEGLASVVVVWRFTGARTLSETAERRVQLFVTGSFWLLAPYIAAESAWEVASRHHAEATAAGIALTAVAVAVMPPLGRAKRRLGLGGHRRGGHPELPVRGPGRRRADRPGHHRRLARCPR